MAPVTEVAVCQQRSIVVDVAVAGRWRRDDLGGWYYVDLNQSAMASHSGGSKPASVTFLTLPVNFDEASLRKRQLWRALSPVQRALLATDGSFTLLLQALAGEEVCVKTLSQTVNSSSCADETLALCAGEDVMMRSALLHTSSGRKLVYARSRIVPHRLSRSIVDELQVGAMAIGLIFRRAKIELFRELIDWGECVLAGEGCEQLGETRCIYRSYTMNSGGRPVAEVREFFSRTLFEG